LGIIFTVLLLDKVAGRTFNGIMARSIFKRTVGLGTSCPLNFLFVNDIV